MIEIRYKMNFHIKFRELPYLCKNCRLIFGAIFVRPSGSAFLLYRVGLMIENYDRVVEKFRLPKSLS